MATGQEDYASIHPEYDTERSKIMLQHNKGLISATEASNELISAATRHNIIDSLPESEVNHIKRLRFDGRNNDLVALEAARIHGIGTPEAYAYISRNFRDRRGEK